MHLLNLKNRSSRRVLSILSRLALCINAATAQSVYAQEPMVIELRRTFSSSECDTGELYLNGRLTVLFQSSPKFYEQYYPSAVIVEEAAMTVEINEPSLFPSGKKNGFLIQNPTIESWRFIMLDDALFTPFTRPRARKTTLPDNAIVLGTSVLNRSCEVTSSASRPKYNEDDHRLSYVTNVLGSQLFGESASYLTFKPGMKRDVLIVLSDKSKSFEIKFGNKSFSLNLPVRAAIDISAGDSCLTEIEHMGNTIISRSGKSYKRRDDVWLCTDGKFRGDPSDAGIEQRRDVRYIEVWSRDVCATVLGIPANRRYYITRRDDGAAETISSQCLNTDPIENIADAPIIAIN